MVKDGKKDKTDKVSKASKDKDESVDDSNNKVKSLKEELKALRKELRAKDRQLQGLQQDIDTVVEENNALKASVDDLQLFKHDGFAVDLINALGLHPQVAHIIAGMARQRELEAEGVHHHILDTKEFHPYLTTDEAYRKATDGDGRKTCCNMFFNDPEKRKKCTKKGYKWCVECSYIRGETFYLCEGCAVYRNGDGVNTRILPLHFQFPPPLSYWEERRYLNNLDKGGDEEE